MLRYLRSDATPLSAEDIQDIIKAKNSMKRASEAMANKYKISSRRVYQIWRGAHPQIDPKDINRFSEEPGSPQQADPVECNVISGSKVKKFRGKKTKSKSVRISELPVIQTPLASISSKSLNISNEELKAFCEKEDKRGEKITEEMNRILAT
ncbi:uncharacterized protein OCT59_013441 [Rhizophagus irregularis]|uniref:uncharacterized protein n=1 Tax=Rhizophagus irregularis TaxID=588596 RepID=UPI000CB8D328|nr:hypothetical protein OCT59_013441 [Rhizophagus irregularis]GBC45520.1 hypothetical protein GLOIN_2v1878018 [Rhizophagus irregularis DAOM 181602=DAOM 197198]CAB5202207.1 unnamed protein product [Rhizophagus irregularis]